jgi:hypothetical protein
MKGLLGVLSAVGYLNVLIFLKLEMIRFLIIRFQNARGFTQYISFQAKATSEQRQLSRVKSVPQTNQ